MGEIAREGKTGVAVRKLLKYVSGNAGFSLRKSPAMHDLFMIKPLHFVIDRVNDKLESGVRIANGSVSGTNPRYIVVFSTVVIFIGRRLDFMEYKITPYRYIKSGANRKENSNEQF